ncbi:MAG: hypothetical protein AAB323_00300 [Pseudomonadota bacterium]
MMIKSNLSVAGLFLLAVASTTMVHAAAAAPASGPTLSQRMLDATAPACLAYEKARDALGEYEETLIKKPADDNWMTMDGRPVVVVDPKTDGERANNDRVKDLDERAQTDLTLKGLRANYDQCKAAYESDLCSFVDREARPLQNQHRNAPLSGPAGS